MLFLKSLFSQHRIFFFVLKKNFEPKSPEVAMAHSISSKIYQLKKNLFKILKPPYPFNFPLFY